MNPSRSSYTPGPWTVGPELTSGRFGGPTIKGGGLTIAVVMSGSGHDNARLIAAAPELLEAAKQAAAVLAELYAVYQTKIGPFASQAQKANVTLGAAIRKATGAL